MSHWEASAGATDEWYTPKYIFDALGCRFDQDVASPVERTHVPADSFIFANGLSGPWVGFVWMNPPFGGRNSLAPWLAKFFDHGNGIALTPDRTSAPWFREAWPRAEVRSARWIARQAAVERNDALGSRLAGNRSAAPSRIQWPRHPRHPGDPPCLTSHPN